MVYYFCLSLKSRKKTPKTVDSKYHSVLNTVLENLRVFKREKTKKPVKILKLLDKIIPKSYFGTTSNRKRFYKVVEKILTQSRFECMHLSVLYKYYDYDEIPWLKDFEPNIQHKILQQHNLFLLDYVVKPLIAFYYKPVRTLNGYEIKFVRKEKFQSFQSKIFHKMKKMEYLIEVKDDDYVKPRGVLIIIPKEDNFRALVSIFPDPGKKSYYKVLTSKIYKVIEEKFKKKESLYKYWSEFTQKTQTPIYGIKIDIRDAYGNVQIPILRNLILSLPTQFLNKEEKKFVINHITNQFVSFRRKTYKWNHGLLQGDRLSGCLCELYLAFTNDIHFPVFDDDGFVHRTVDDFFYCSPHLDKIYRFGEHIRYAHQVNSTKTRTNLSTFHHPQDEIPYCGKIFNMTTRQVRTLYKVTPQFEIRHKFRLWNFKNQIGDDNPRRFLEKAMEFSFISNSLTKFEMNTVFNNQKTVLENFYDAMIWVAFKFDAAVMALRSSFLNCDFSYIWIVLKSTIGTYSSRVFKRIDRLKGGNYKNITFICLKIIAWRAFLAVFKRRSVIYRKLINKIKTGTNLTMKFHDDEVEPTYFCTLPEKFRCLKINRKAPI
ncbi:uncharacterized protein LOC123007257 isoform X2 [Tribolium madens]|nr:uncharacterized protein LOC123007257 isoform X2 [Tribolium madens]XP_044258402.1 uncharacterized protein LOC123007257 isoform X2 [Tribolium madens]XP_044258412.1 uncharacterized protein LOC123007257 isoform X2 [Tribolium madens]